MIFLADHKTDMGLQRSSFPDLGLLGDSVFTYNLEKESEIQAEHDDLWLKEYKKKKRAHIQEIAHSSMLTEQEKEWMEEYVPQYTTVVTSFSKLPQNIQSVLKALLTFQRINFLGLLSTQRRTASEESPGLVLKDIFEDGGAF
jgi:hypothetical protein